MHSAHLPDVYIVWKTFLELPILFNKNQFNLFDSQNISGSASGGDKIRPPKMVIFFCELYELKPTFRNYSAIYLATYTCICENRSKSNPFYNSSEMTLNSKQSVLNSSSRTRYGRLPSYAIKWKFYTEISQSIWNRSTKRIPPNLTTAKAVS